MESFWSLKRIKADARLSDERRNTWKVLKYGCSVRCWTSVRFPFPSICIENSDDVPGRAAALPLIERFALTFPKIISRISLINFLDVILP